MGTIINIGFSKTASSWFQTYFYPNIQNIGFINKHIIREQIIEPNSFDFNPDKIKEYFKVNYSNRLLLSHENLVGPVNSGGLNGFATKELGIRIKSIFPDANIIIFIRNQADIIASANLQEIMEGSTYNIDSFLYHKGKNLYNNMMMFSFAFLEYDKTIKFYYDLFGQNKVHIFLYEDFLNDKLNFLTNFCSIFNLEINFNNLNKEKYNNRLQKYLFPLVRGSNFFTNKNTVFKHYLFNIPYLFPVSRKIFFYANKFKVFGNFPTSVQILGEKNYNYINDYYRVSNNVLHDKFGINSIKNYNYPL